MSAEIIKAAIAAATGGNSGVADAGDSGDGGDTGGDQGEVDNGTDTGDGEDDGTPDASADGGDNEPDNEPDSGDEPDQSAGDESAGDEPDPEPEPEVESDPFAAEHGLKEKDGQGRTNRIPYPAVKRIVGNAERKVFKAITGQDLPKDAKLSDAVNTFKTSIGERDSKITHYEGELENIGRGEHVMLHEPERFLEILPTLNPRYAELLAGKAQRQENVPSDKPEPDYELPNGAGKTYSPAGLQKLMEWHAEQVTKKVLGENDKVLKPIKDQQAQRDYEQKVLLPRITAQVEHAKKNWKNFDAWATEISETLTKHNTDPKNAKNQMGLADAYNVVRERKYEEELAKTRTTAEAERKKALKHLKNQGQATGVNGKAGKKVEDAEQAGQAPDNRSVIRNAIKAAGLK